MANRPAPALVLREGDLEKLESWVRSRTVTSGLDKRARMVLLAAEGIGNSKIADRVGASRTTVIEWRDRYDERGLAGLKDLECSGRPREFDHRQIVTETLKLPPKKLGVTHWSSQLLADRIKVSASTIQRAWRGYGIKPWKAESFRFSTDPELVGKVTDICGLYLAPPENAIVLCVDEKSQIQALDRTVPILPMQEGRVGRRSHDYYRHGTSTLFAALDIATGQVTAALKPRHCHQEFVAFLRQIERAHRPRRRRRGGCVRFNNVPEGDHR
ncbi:IS630 family transposase [Corynebacterium sp. CCM 9185]|uniref:IS630 family transposase n=1 Tax=Corynebacterium marambiense TaxID=2765364 RepID=UPI001E3EE3A0|nr:IS630 family transposase [Corynebacterium marambiense]MCK7663841.1 IS630 family transposase [Corynebacterium marambiense]